MVIALGIVLLGGVAPAAVAAGEGCGRCGGGGSAGETVDGGAADGRWTATWTSSADPTPVPLAEQTLSQTVHVPVAEIQSLVSPV